MVQRNDSLIADFSTVVADSENGRIIYLNLRENKCSSRILTFAKF